MSSVWVKKLVAFLLLGGAVVFVVEMRNSKAADQKGAPCASCVECPLPGFEKGAAPDGGAEEPASSAKPVAEQVASRPRLLDLGADSCIPCKMMMPILEEMTETFAEELEVQFIDVWKNNSAAKKYGIRVIPTQIFFDEDGNELFRHEGFFAREDMLAKWKEFGFEFDGQE